MKTFEEIVKAHDTLATVLEAAPTLVRIDMRKVRDRMGAARDALCWVLGHESDFKANLNRLEQQLAEAGIELVREVSH